jgi:hypothetical protein
MDATAYTREASIADSSGAVHSKYAKVAVLQEDIAIGSKSTS